MSELGLDYVSAGLDDSVREWDGEFTPIEAGEYEVEIAEVERKESKKGNPMLVPTFKVIGFADGRDTDSVGATLRGYYVEQGPGRGRLKALLNAVEALDAKGGYSPGELPGKRLLVSIVQESFTAMNENMESVSRTSSKIRNERPVERKTPPKTARR